MLLRPVLLQSLTNMHSKHPAFYLYFTLEKNLKVERYLFLEVLFCSLDGMEPPWR